MTNSSRTHKSFWHWPSGILSSFGFRHSSFPVSFSINIFLQRAAHHVERCGLAGPNFERLRALMQQHAEAVGGFAAGGLGGLEQRRFPRTVNHVINRARLFE